MIGAGVLTKFALGGVASRVPWQLWAAAGVVVFLGIAAWQIDSRAYDRGFAEAERQWKERVEQELKRQDEANQEALRFAREQIRQLRKAKEVRDAEISRLNEEAEQDPDADRPSVNTRGVRRLNSILD